MRQHIFCFAVFIIIFGLMSIGTVDAATITEYFDSDPGWHSFNLPINNNDFGFRNSNFAGGNPGEAGGSFSRSDQVAWYGDDTIGNFTGNEVLSASGLMNIYNVEPGYNHNFHIGHFDSSSDINGIGFVILENQSTSPFSFRIHYTIGDTYDLLFTITGINESRTWSYLYDPDDGSYGSLTVSISGSGGNTETVFLSESQLNSIGTLNTFGLAWEGQEYSAPEQLEFYIDNVSYTCESITYYRDFDSDGYGDPQFPFQACSQPVGYVENKLDCDDSDPSVHPGAREIENGKDDDCDGQVDEPLAMPGIPLLLLED